MSATEASATFIAALTEKLGAGVVNGQMEKGRERHITITLTKNGQTLLSQRVAVTSNPEVPNWHTIWYWVDRQRLERGCRLTMRGGGWNFDQTY